MSCTCTVLKVVIRKYKINETYLLNLKHYGNTVEALFQWHPENDELLFDFVTVIAFISGSMRIIVDIDHLYEHFRSSVLSNLNHRNEDSSLHICHHKLSAVTPKPIDRTR